ncbi:AraC family transcriptional regulator [Pseudacidovorax sp. RU35E]|uniref:AraC family transcriptional regulator n=1 Tax=Pseudacidovorax sp. RU35E TaxID=1907403 RepID=UPI000954B30B|nr:AraC family transcriptional regulator [Pseudacidovorax sp. RU35E]SIR50367.1 transcriptional regulator, AraC family [Pseudacidovorax sp. RU35E]
MAHLISPEELPRWVPGEVLCSSEGLAWKDVGLRVYRYEGLGVEVPQLTQFMIVAYRHGSTRVDRRFDGRWTRTECHPGDVSLLTRSQASHWHWTEPVDVAHAYLSKSLVSRIAADMFERSVSDVRLHDLLRVQDPVVSGLVNAMASETSDTALGGALYVDALSTQLAVHPLRRHASVDLVEHSTSGRFAPALRRRIADHIEAHLEQNLTLDVLAALANTGVWTFTKHFRMSFQTTPTTTSSNAGSRVPRNC